MPPLVSAPGVNAYADVDEVELTAVQMEDAALDLCRQWQEDPALFYHDVLGVEPWEKQVETALGVRDFRETSVFSCHASGKSWNASAIVLWFMFAYPNSIVLTTAPTFRQVKDILWRELNAKFDKARYKLGKSINKTELSLASDWFAIGLSTNDPDKFQGYHSTSGHLLVVVDESAGVQELIFEAVDSVMTSEYCRLLMVGNPTSNSGRFFNSVRTPGVNKIQIKAWDTPNFTGLNLRTPADLCAIYCPPDGASPEEKAAFRIPAIDLPNPKLCSPVWVHERFHAWGEHSPMYQSRVEAIFPEEGENTLIPLQWIENAMSDARRNGEEVYEYDSRGRIKMANGGPVKKWIPPIPKGAPSYGVDVARFGTDRTVICYRLGNNVQYLKSYTKQKTTDTTSRVQYLLKSEPNVDVFIDIIGVGAGVYDQLADIVNARNNPDERHRIHGVNVSRIPYEDLDAEARGQEKPGRFVNLRAELYWNLRTFFERNLIALPYDEDLANELSQLQFKITRGKIQIEEKEEMKKRLQKSPDLADALMLSFANPGYDEFTDEMAKKDVRNSALPEQPEGDWEPGMEDEEEVPDTAGLYDESF